MNENDLNTQQSVEPVTPTEPVAPSEPITQAPVTPAPEVAQAEPQVAQPVQPTMQAPVQPVPEPEKKKSKAPIIIVILLLLIIAGGVAVYFLFFKKVSSKKVIDGTINQMFNKATAVGSKIDDYVIVDYKKNIVEIKNDLNAELELNIDGEKQSFKDVNQNLDLKVDIANKMFSGSLKTSQAGKEGIAGNVFVENKMLYLKSNVTDKVIKYDLSEELDIDEIYEFLDGLPDANSVYNKEFMTKTKVMLTNSIKDEYLEQSEGEFTIDGTNVKGLKTTLNLSELNCMKILYDFALQVYADDSYINTLASYSFTSASEYKQQFGDSIDKLKQSIDSYERSSYSVDYKFNIYTTAQGKFQAMELLSGENVLVTAVSNNNVTTFKLYSNNKVVYSFIYNEKDKEFEFKYEEATIKVKFITDGIQVNASMGSNSITLTLTDKVSNESVLTDLSISGNYTENKDSISGSLKMKNEYKKADSIDKFDISNAISEDELTEEDLDAIAEKAEELVSDYALYAPFYNLFTVKDYVNSNNMYIEYDDDFDLDY